MRVRDIMTRNPDVCMLETDLREVARMMLENDVGAIPIIENRDTMKPIGIITDRDITCRIVAKGLDPQQHTAKDAMTPHVATVRPDTDLEECLRKMEEHQIRRMLVVDESGRCCGIVAQADIARQARPEQVSELVRDVSEKSPNPSAFDEGGQQSQQIYH